MKFGAWIAVVVLASLLREGQANEDDTTNQGSTFTAEDMASEFLRLTGSSSLETNLKAVNASLDVLENAMKGLKTSGQVEKLESEILDFGFQITGTLSKLILDPPISMANLFEQFAMIPQNCLHFIFQELSTNIKAATETFGCVRVEQFVSILKRGFYKGLQIVENVHQIDKIVLNAEDVRGGSVNNVDPSQLNRLVGALELNLKHFNNTITTFSTVFKSTVGGIEKTNKFLIHLNSKANLTRSEMNSTAVQANITANTQSINVQSKYTAVQLSIKTDLTNALTGLLVFSGSKMWNSLAEDNKKSYANLYRFLKKRNQSDLSAINEYFFKLGDRTAKSINQTVEIFIDAVNRTGLRLADIVLEGGSHADSCFTSYSKIFVSPFTSLETFVSSCVQKEAKRWTLIANTIDDMLKLAKLNSQELSSNLGRCSSMYVNYATFSEDYVRAKACLKANLEDLNDLPDVLNPLLLDVNQKVKREVKASIFRVENCLATNLRENMEGLKYARSAMKICAGTDSECLRNSSEGDVHEMFQRGWDVEHENEDSLCNYVVRQNFRFQMQPKELDPQSESSM